MAGISRLFSVGSFPSLCTAPRRWFLAIAFGAGAVFTFLLPPFQSPDEPAHFFRAWEVSEGDFFPGKTPEARLGGRVPASLDSLAQRFAYLKNDYAARTSFQGIVAAGSIPLNKKAQIFKDFPNTAIYAPTAYLPQAAAIVLLRAANAPPLWMLYGARLANLLVWCLLLAAALRSMPFQVSLMALMAALPAGLVIAASANADVVTNGLAFWLVAVLLKGEERKAGPFFNRNFWPMLAAALVVAANKIIYLPLLGVFWLGATAAEFKSRVAWGRFLLLVSGSLLVAGLWGKHAGAQFLPFDQYNPGYRAGLTLNEGVDPAAQLRHMAKAPGRFLSMSFSSLVRALPSAAAHAVGKFGWEKNYLHPLGLGLLWLGLLAGAFFSGNPLGRGERWMAGGLVVLVVLLFAVTMYALWSPVGCGEISNWQGRYFVPVLPLLGLLLGKRQAPENAPGKSAVMWQTLGVLWWLAQGAMIWAIWMRYYG